MHVISSKGKVYHLKSHNKNVTGCGIHIHNDEGTGIKWYTLPYILNFNFKGKYVCKKCRNILFNDPLNEFLFGIVSKNMEVIEKSLFEYLVNSDCLKFHKENIIDVYKQDQYLYDPVNNEFMVEFQKHIDNLKKNYYNSPVRNFKIYLKNESRKTLLRIAQKQTSKIPFNVWTIREMHDSRSY